MESQADSELSDRPPVDLFVEEGELSKDQEFGESEQPTSEEQTYRETMSGISSFMGWSHVPDVDNSNSSDDNPFVGPKAPVPNKMSVHMPTDEWLCKKLNKLNFFFFFFCNSFNFFFVFFLFTLFVQQCKSPEGRK